MRPRRFVLTVIVVLLLASPALAHVPRFPEDNESPGEAVVVPDPVKSWSFYDSLQDGQVKYYRATLGAGERLTVGAFTPMSGPFTPSLVVMSPALEASGSVPDGVVVPDGMDAVVVEGDRPASARYEPFGPSANYHTASFEHTVDRERTYLIAVYEPADRTGPAGVSIGSAESFTPTEYLTVPFDLIEVHLWEGQSPLVVVGPVLLTVVAGLGAVRRRWQESWDHKQLRATLSGAGLLVLGSGVNTAVQTSVALGRTGPTAGVLVTTAFIVVPLVGGSWVVAGALGPTCPLTPRRRLGLALTGVAALLTWAGFIVGPLVLIGVAGVPSRAASR